MGVWVKEYLIEQAKSNSTAPLVDLWVWLEFKLGLDLDDLALHKYEFEGSRGPYHAAATSSLQRLSKYAAKFPFK